MSPQRGQPSLGADDYVAHAKRGRMDVDDGYGPTGGGGSSGGGHFGGYPQPPFSPPPSGPNYPNQQQGQGYNNFGPGPNYGPSNYGPPPPNYPTPSYGPDSGGWERAADAYKELADARQQYAALAGELGDARVKEADLRARIRERDRAIDDAENQIKTLQAERDRLVKEVSRLNDELKPFPARRGPGFSGPRFVPHGHDEGWGGSTRSRPRVDTELPTGAANIQPPPGPAIASATAATTAGTRERDGPAQSTVPPRTQSGNPKRATTRAPAREANAATAATPPDVVAAPAPKLQGADAARRKQHLRRAIPRPVNAPRDHLGRYPEAAADIDVVCRFFRCASVNAWPSGMRLASGALPSGDGFGVPLSSDCRAFFLLWHLLPQRAKKNPHHEHDARIRTLAMELFSIPGWYERIVAAGEFVGQPQEAPIRYPYPADDASPILLSAWFCVHGVALDRDVIASIRHWATRSRNESLGRVLDDASPWPAPPIDVDSVTSAAEIALVVKYDELAWGPRLLETHESNHGDFDELDDGEDI
ncbi:uncharacterized protein TRAVEDRAFT_23406 [Trametes versicolor FP-101664 SS1]|uniref:uncharacterized protein n=1 Tax=Trametes versicolor (strain FP-101664) TaxID=717944 RepID=UPI0004623BED|nr:uncharacterized protein TRAVEDRAFT_23406 [Trametes versicolor FP-101664 SS1]EIW54291.1 hypothetical protein TRAVEDRAFT_23406 [Trametes versicolor FP-101664 SS1]